MNSNLDVKRSFIRGVSDTDFSLVFKKRTRCNNYPVISHTTSDRILSIELRKLLIEIGIYNTGGDRINNRYGKFHDAYYLQISGRKLLDKWVNEIRPSSYNFLNRYNNWRKLEE